MSRERDEKFDPTQPALIVNHGNTQRKFRRLEKDVLVLGRAAGCDVGLEAPDVAAVHCLIVRTADGWRVRDCTGRGGTRINGCSVQDGPVADEDVLQIGSFSFTFHLPPRPRAAGFAGLTNDAALRRLLHSRQNLAQLALHLRGRLRQGAVEAAGRVEEQLAERQEALDRQAHELEALQHDLDARLGEMRQTKQAIASEGLALLQRHERVEKELTARQARSDAVLAASLEEYQARRRQEEAALDRLLAEQQRVILDSAGDGPHRLELRAKELECYAQHLRRTRQRLGDHEESLAVRRQERLAEKQEATEQLARPGPDFEALRLENEQLRRTLAQRDQALAAAREEAQGRAPEAEAALDHFHFELLEALEQLRGSLRPVEVRWPTRDTVADMPSPLLLGERGACPLIQHAVSRQDAE